MTPGRRMLAVLLSHSRNTAKPIRFLLCWSVRTCRECLDSIHGLHSQAV